MPDCGLAACLSTPLFNECRAFCQDAEFVPLPPPSPFSNVPDFPPVTLEPQDFTSHTIMPALQSATPPACPEEEGLQAALLEDVRSQRELRGKLRARLTQHELDGLLNKLELLRGALQEVVSGRR